MDKNIMYELYGPEARKREKEIKNKELAPEGRKISITSDCVKFILNASRNFYPKEFFGLLSGNDNLINEVLIIPGSEFGDTFSTMNAAMVPEGVHAIGSVHSHPGKSFSPSDADLNLFGKYKVNIITKSPYNDTDDVAAYDASGKRIGLDVEDNPHFLKQRAGLICPKCRGSRIVYAGTSISGGGTGTGTTEQKYLCKDCGYVGAFVLDVSERGKSEHDIAMEKDLIKIKKELELEGFT